MPELTRRGADVRGFVRHERQAAQVEANGASQVVLGDLSDADSVRAALDGVDAAFYVAPAFVDHEADLGVGFVDAAVGCGVRRIVFSSVVHPVLSSLVNHAAKAPVEERILDSGLEYTFLHPALFFQMLGQRYGDIVGRGVLDEPWSSETSFSRVDYRDVAEVAARAVVDDDLLWGTFELCSERPRNRHEVAAVISEVAGRPIEARRSEPPDPARSGPMAAMFAHYDRVGLMANPLTLEACLGRPPRTLEDYLREVADQTAAST